MKQTTAKVMTRIMSCPKCSDPMGEKTGPSGKHLRCLSWRDCPGRLDLEKPSSAPVGAATPVALNHSRCERCLPW